MQYFYFRNISQQKMIIPNKMNIVPNTNIIIGLFIKCFFWFIIKNKSIIPSILYSINWILIFITSSYYLWLCQIDCFKCHNPVGILSVNFFTVNTIETIVIILAITAMYCCKAINTMAALAVYINILVLIADNTVLTNPFLYNYNIVFNPITIK